MELKWALPASLGIIPHRTTQRENQPGSKNQNQPVVTFHQHSTNVRHLRRTADLANATFKTHITAQRPSSLTTGIVSRAYPNRRIQETMESLSQYAKEITQGLKQLALWVPAAYSHQTRYRELAALCDRIVLLGERCHLHGGLAWSENTPKAASLHSQLKHLAESVLPSAFESIVPFLIDAVLTEVSEGILTITNVQNHIHQLLIHALIGASNLLYLDDITWPPFNKLCPRLVSGVDEFLDWVCMLDSIGNLGQKDTEMALCFVSGVMICIRNIQGNNTRLNTPTGMVARALDLCVTVYENSTLISTRTSPTTIMQLVLARQKLDVTPSAVLEFNASSASAYRAARLAIVMLPDSSTRFSPPSLAKKLRFLSAFCQMLPPVPSPSRVRDGCVAWSLHLLSLQVRDPTVQPLISRAILRLWARAQPCVDPAEIGDLCTAALIHCMRLSHSDMQDRTRGALVVRGSHRDLTREKFLIWQIVDELVPTTHALPTPVSDLHTAIFLPGFLTALEAQLREPHISGIHLRCVMHMTCRYTCHFCTLSESDSIPHNQLLSMNVTLRKQILSTSPSNSPSLPAIFRLMHLSLSRLNTAAAKQIGQERNRLRLVLAITLKPMLQLISNAQPCLEVLDRDRWPACVRAHARMFPRSAQLLQRCCNVDCINLDGLSDAALKTMHCSCRHVMYCSVACQLADWVSGGHSKVCTARRH